MKHLVFTVILLALSLPSFAEKDRGGGDMCESRIQSIANDIQDWIRKGGARALRLHPPITIGVYESQMSRAINSARVQCVSPGDKGHPVQISGTPKICLFDRSRREVRITCDAAKFSALNENDQYVLVHHEYAGISGLETPNGDVSTYKLSKQISGYLVNQTVKRLAVKSAPQPAGDLGLWKTVNVSSVQELPTKIKEAAAELTYGHASRINHPIIQEDGVSLPYNMSCEEHQVKKNTYQCKSFLRTRHTELLALLKIKVSPSKQAMADMQRYGYEEPKQYVVAIPVAGHCQIWNGLEIWNAVNNVGVASAIPNKHDPQVSYCRGITTWDWSSPDLIVRYRSGGVSVIEKSID